MTQYSSVNVKLSNSQLQKLKSSIRNDTEVTLNLSSNMIDDSSYETNFPHKLLLTYGQVSRLRKVFANNSSANIKFSKTQLFKVVQLGGFFGPSLAVLEPTFKEARFGREIVKNLDRAKSEKEILKPILD